MTNEELYRQYLSGDTEAFEQLYLQIQGFIASVARDAAQNFGCADKEMLDELCAEIHYGKTHLCTFFKKQTGKTIYRTYLKLKTDEAKKLIRRKVSFTEIAERLCFDSLPHFNYIFKNGTGMTPGEYKKSINSSDVR